MGTAGKKRSPSGPLSEEPLPKKHAPTRLTGGIPVGKYGLAAGATVSGAGAADGAARRNKKYTFTQLSDVPSSLKIRVVAKCSLEFLEVDDEDVEPEGLQYHTNHCIIRFTFKDVLTEASRWAPAGTRGAIITCNHVPFATAGGLQAPSRIRIQTFTHDGPHKRAVKVVDVPVLLSRDTRRDTTTRGTTRERRLMGFLRVIEQASMATVGYSRITDQSVYGCRDWTSQLLNRWHSAGMVALRPIRISFWDHFNYTYGPNDKKGPSKVRRAAFSAAYNRIPIPEIEYNEQQRPRVFDPTTITDWAQGIIDDLNSGDETNS